MRISGLKDKIISAGVIYYGALMLLHFCVDFLCGFRLYSIDSTSLNVSLAIVLYNALAFLTQPLIGYLFEKKCSKLLLAASVFIILIGSMLPEVWSAAIVLGLGNSLFHVVGGKLTVMTTERETPLGLFVAPGAIGVALGMFVHGHSLWGLAVSALALMTVVAFFPVSAPTLKTDSEDSHPAPVIIIIVILAVLIRSFLGSYTRYEITLPYFVVLVGLAATLGKMLGGIISDFFSPTVTVVFSSLAAMVFLPFVKNPIMAVIGIALFNLAMPVTLRMACRLFPNNRAFAFGLLASLLVPGYFVGLALRSYYNVLVLSVVLFVNGVLLLIACAQMKKKVRTK